MANLKEMFFQECDDLLEGLSEGLADLESDTADAETVNSMFRAVHSLKGGAGAFHLDQLVKFAHSFENVLDAMRSGEMQSDQNVVSLLFTASDHLADLVEAARNGSDLPAEQGASILSDLMLLSGEEEAEGGASDDAFVPEFQPMILSIDEDLPSIDGMETDGAVNSEIKIFLKPHASFYANGHDTALFLRELAKLGEMTVQTDVSNLVPLSEAPWSSPALAWTITLLPDSTTSEGTVRDVFEFAEGLCDLDIASVLGTEFPAPPVISDLPPLNDLPPLPVDVSEGPMQPVLPSTKKPEVSPVKQAAPSDGDQRAPKVGASKSSTIRVDLERVDRLINLVGELVIAEAMLRQSMSELQHSANVDEAIGQLKQLSGAIQESVMAIRAQPVRSLFQRMSRIVRETSKVAEKSARMVTIGDGTEVDKTVTERLVDPLTHMIRNAVDHGIELPEQRVQAGKDERGTVTLEAAHRSGRVVITLSDDGAGINRPKVRQIAEEKGLVRPDDDLTDADIDNLLFRPGFSTAGEISNLSGRGVGMDVVRNEIQALGGRVNLSSVPGEGTSVTISLPLTLAVLEGMIVKIGDQSLIVPTLPLREMLQPGQALIHSLCEGDMVLALGDEIIPITDLGVALGYRKEAKCVAEQSLLLIEADSGRRTALAVDEIAEQREVVIKGLEQNYQSIPGIAAATILGDGKIALIVDTDQMITLPESSSSKHKFAVHSLEYQNA